METIIILVFALGYLAITVEHSIKIDKLIPALVMMAICWALIALGIDSKLLEWDARSNTTSINIDNAHSVCIRHLDYNPHKPNQIATSGDDCFVRIWDTKNTKKVF